MMGEGKRSGKSYHVLAGALLITGLAVVTVLSVFVIRGHKENAGSEAEMVEESESEGSTESEEVSMPAHMEKSQSAETTESMEAQTFTEESTFAAEESSEGTSESEEVPVDPYAYMNFQGVEEEVTAKEATNLRDIPSQGEDSAVLAVLQNGEVVQRIAVSAFGWSRLLYQGEVYYAVSSLLTTDLNYHVGEEPDDGIKTVFTPCNERVTPKIEVNLRRLPSVTHEDATVVVTLQHGEVVVRTGINTDVGWSRVEYNGEVLYCISSYVTAAK